MTTLPSSHSNLIAAALFSAAALLVCRPAVGQEQAPYLHDPIDCVLGKTCFIQQYVDMDTGPAALDPFCGPRSYDRHKGTDFRLRHLGELAKDVPVLAAAPGVVRGVRDGLPDQLYTGQDLQGKDCGNGVRIDHGGGWATQYCHMKQGSISVVPEQWVAAGARLGAVGLSGRTEFPHLHFSLFKDGDPVDPFTSRKAGEPCGPGHPMGAGMFNAYRSAAALDAGFAAAAPTYPEVKSGAHRVASLPIDSPALVFWAEMIGVRKGDRFELRLFSPDRSKIAEQSLEMPRDRAAHFLFAGRKRPSEGWPSGVYQGEARLVRGGVVVAEIYGDLELR